MHRWDRKAGCRRRRSESARPARRFGPHLRMAAFNPGREVPRDLASGRHASHGAFIRPIRGQFQIHPSMDEVSTTDDTDFLIFARPATHSAFCEFCPWLRPILDRLSQTRSYPVKPIWRLRSRKFAYPPRPRRARAQRAPPAIPFTAFFARFYAYAAVQRQNVMPQQLSACVGSLHSSENNFPPETARSCYSAATR